MKLKTAIVLVGGKGLRMRSKSGSIPKCMVPVSDRPLLFWSLTWLKLNGIEKVILGVDYKKDVIVDYIRENPFDLEIVFNDHSGADDTGDAIRMAIENQDVQDEVFLVMNGDEMTDVSLQNFLTFHKMHSPVATLLSCPLRSNFGILKVGPDHTITEFREKPMIDTHFINAGVYIFTQAIREYLPEKGSIEKITFANLAKEGKIKAFKYFGFWATANNPKDIEALEEQAEILKETRGMGD